MYHQALEVTRDQFGGMYFGDFGSDGSGEDEDIWSLELHVLMSLVRCLQHFK